MIEKSNFRETLVSNGTPSETRPFNGYPFETRRFRGDPFRISLRCDRISIPVFVIASDEHDKIDEPPKA